MYPGKAISDIGGRGVWNMPTQPLHRDTHIHNYITSAQHTESDN